MAAANSTIKDNFTMEKFYREAHQEPTYLAGRKVQTYGAPPIVILGLIGNCLSFLAMMLPHNRKKSICIYLAALAVTDAGSLMGLSYLWFVTELGVLWTDCSCKIWAYFVYIMTGGSAFTLLVVTFDRWIALCFPFKAPIWCTLERSKIVLAVMYTFVTIFYIPIALQAAVKGEICVSYAEKTSISVVISHINFMIIPAIPFFLMLIMNIMIIKKVYISKAWRSKNSSRRNKAHSQGNSVYEKKQNNNQVDLNQRFETECVPSVSQKLKKFSRFQIKRNSFEPRASIHNYHLTIILLLVSFTFLGIVLPISVRVRFYSSVNVFESTKTYGIFVLLYSSLNLLLFSNNAINFYLYIMSGSVFRTEIKEMLFCKSKRPRHVFNSSRKSIINGLENGKV